MYLLPADIFPWLASPGDGERCFSTDISTPLLETKKQKQSIFPSQWNSGFWHNGIEVNRPHNINRLWEQFRCRAFCSVFYIKIVFEDVIEELELKGVLAGNKKWCRKCNLALDDLIFQKQIGLCGVLFR